MLLAVFAVALLLAGCGSSHASNGAGSHKPAAKQQKLDGTALPVPRDRPNIPLTDTSGKPYNFATQTQGHPTLLYFGYTHCPDICPTTMADIGLALRKVPATLRAKTEVVFVTTDPKRDTPAVIGRWLAHFDQHLPVPFVGLTGSVQQVQVAQQLAGVPVAHDNGATHSTELLLFGPDDKARIFYASASLVPSEVSHDLPIVAAGSATGQ